jgi:hypothetical protein
MSANIGFVKLEKHGVVISFVGWMGPWAREEQREREEITYLYSGSRTNVGAVAEVHLRYRSKSEDENHWMCLSRLRGEEIKCFLKQ